MAGGPTTSPVHPPCAVFLSAPEAVRGAAHPRATDAGTLRRCGSCGHLALNARCAPASMDCMAPRHTQPRPNGPKGALHHLALSGISGPHPPANLAHGSRSQRAKERWPGLAFSRLRPPHRPTCQRANRCPGTPWPVPRCPFVVTSRRPPFAGAVVDHLLVDYSTAASGAKVVKPCRRLRIGATPSVIELNEIALVSVPITLSLPFTQNRSLWDRVTAKLSGPVTGSCTRIASAAQQIMGCLAYLCKAGRPNRAPDASSAVPAGLGSSWAAPTPLGITPPGYRLPPLRG